jgi:hypothetical protein
MAHVTDQVASLDLWAGEEQPIVACASHPGLVPGPLLKIVKPVQAPSKDRLAAIGFHVALSRAVFASSQARPS